MADADSDLSSALANVPLFAGLNKRHLNRLAKSMRKVVHKPDQAVASEGTGGLAFHVITAGHASVTIGGRPVRSLGPADYFGEISMIDGEPRSATVVANSDGLTTYTLNRTQFLALVKEEPSIAQAVMVALCARIRASESLR